MESVIKVLEKEYQIQIETSTTAIQSCRFTGAFYKVSAIDIVKAIALNFNLEYEVVGDHEFRLKGEGCLR